MPGDSMSLSRCTLALLSLLVVSGCIPQYYTPRFDPKGTDFRGIASYLHDASEVKVIFVHGICTHDSKHWIDEGWDPQIKRALQAALEQETHAAELAPRVRPYDIQKRTYFIGPSQRKKLDARFIIWSDATKALKSKLLYDDAPPAGEFQWRRAKVNASFKEGLLNDCLSDAVIYAGVQGDSLRNVMKQAVCEALDLQFDPHVGSCVAPAGSTDPQPPIVIVTESLGSKMVFDSLLALTASRSSAALEKRLASIPQIYMMANQLPLLDLAHTEGQQSISLTNSAAVPAEQDTARRFARLLMEARRLPGAPGRNEMSFKALRSEISLVAFTDPNDLLSYRLLTSGWPDGVAVSNVLASNAGSFLGFVVENPLPAHTAYNKNARVMELVLCGSRKQDCKGIGSW